MTEYALDGTKILSEADFHRAFAGAPGVPSYYGHNINALWDVITTDLERPYLFIWHNARFSKEALGDYFQYIVSFFDDATEQDRKWGMAEPLRLIVHD